MSFPDLVFPLGDSHSAKKSQMVQVGFFLPIQKRREALFIHVAATVGRNGNIDVHAGQCSDRDRAISHSGEFPI